MEPKQTEQFFGDDGRGGSSLAQQRYHVRSRCQLADQVLVVSILGRPPFTDPAGLPARIA